jgi:hypothetical protein
MKVMIDAMAKEHKRFRELADVPSHIFDRIEDHLQRLRVEAHSNYQHSLRMEKQTKNIQEQVRSCPAFANPHIYGTNLTLVPAARAHQPGNRVGYQQEHGYKSANSGGDKAEYRGY